MSSDSPWGLATVRYRDTLRQIGEGGAGPRHDLPGGAKPFITPIAAPGSRHAPARHHHVDAPERPGGRDASSSGIAPSHIMAPAPEPTQG